MSMDDQPATLISLIVLAVMASRWLHFLQGFECLGNTIRLLESTMSKTGSYALFMLAWAAFNLLVFYILGSSGEESSLSAGAKALFSPSSDEYALKWGEDSSTGTVLLVVWVVCQVVCSSAFVFLLMALVQQTVREFHSSNCQILEYQYKCQANRISYIYPCNQL